ncbi:protein arginine kinase [Clostridium sp. DJ247]|uniref:protein arginine kinase n=1 Tax=Clostridium sp. DJ247 TaxID=2726188 RepID=UPI0016279A9D|nr:protein arginine kinase [Clostridium sp. DJ247]MBC2582536.1 protein arginine kinase [Clostridium sp. DJ247]
MENWIKSNGKNEDLVLSSRIRLARNLNDTPFPHKLSVEGGKEVVNLIEDAFYTSSHTSDEFKTNYLWKKDSIENEIFLERHLISRTLLEHYNKAAFILDKNETTGIMINEEDHVRIQCITSGFNLEEVYDVSNKIDNLLEEKLTYAFDERLGYLTSCPTNIGSGIRASIMIHLPALSLNNKMTGILNAVSQLGMTIRGLYGEGSKAEGNIYQISNQVTLGLSEEEIVNNLKAVVSQIINQENITRETFFTNYKYELEDKIYRGLGILKSSVLLDIEECLKLLSDVRLGVEMGIIKDVDKVTLNNLLVDTQGATIQGMYNKKLSDKEIKFYRAKLVRDRLTKH